MKKQILTIHGGAGSGKNTTIATLLAYFLDDYQEASTGKIARDIAKVMCPEVPFNDFPAYAREKGIPYDEIIDEHLRELGKKDMLIVDCRLGYYFIQHGFAVLLQCSSEEAARRVVANEKRVEFGRDAKEIALEFEKRNCSDREKYLELYQTDITNISNYQLVVDTEGVGKDKMKVATEIISAYKKWLINC